MKYLFLILLFLSVIPARAGVVRTLDGNTHEGQLVFEPPGQLAVRQPTGNTLRLELDDVLSAQFKADLAPGPIRPDRWTGRDIGKLVTGGSARFSGESVTIHAAGADVGGTQDACHFVYQNLEADGQLIARVASIQQTHPQAKAGIMIRAGLEPNAPYAIALVHAGGGASFQLRKRVNEATRLKDPAQVSSPLWLKLVRKRDTFTAFYSPDGQSWQPLGSESFTLPRVLQVGLVVSSHHENAVCAATFEKPSLTPGSPQETRTTPTFKGVVLRNGSLLYGDPRSADSSVLRLGRDRELAIPLTDIARIHFTSLKPELARQLDPTRPGVLLTTTGDFFEGDIVGIEHGRTTVNSVLFGRRRIDSWQIGVAILRQPSPTATRFQVRLSDGSSLLTDQLAAEKDRLIITVPGAGPLKVSPNDLIEISAGAGRLQSLCDLKPADITRPNSGCLFAIDATTCGLPLSLGGRLCSRGVALSAGASATWQLDESYRMLILRIGLPEGLLPVSTARFVIHADGRELYRSQLLSSLDPPQDLTLSITKIRKLTFALEAAPNTHLPAHGLLADPVLIK